MVRDFYFFFSTAPSSAPTHVTLIAAGSSAANLMWTSLPAEDWNGDRRGFIITLVEVETGQTQSNHTLRNSAATSYLISTLHPFYNYRCRIAAFNSAGTGPFSDMATVMLPPAGKPGSWLCVHVDRM